MKLILADDHELFRTGLSLVLKQQIDVCEILEGCSLESALEEAELHPDADVALLDLHMPGMDGSHGVRRFIETCPSLPLIILTGAEEPSHIHEVLSAGASGFIPKSSSPAVMLSAIQLVLSGGTYIPPQLLAGNQGNLEQPNNKPLFSKDRSAIQLTERQMQVLRLMAQGKSNKMICRELEIEDGTVKAHIATIFRVLDVGNRTEAASVARNMGLLN